MQTDTVIQMQNAVTETDAGAETHPETDAGTERYGYTCGHR